MKKHSGCGAIHVLAVLALALAAVFGETRAQAAITTTTATAAAEPMPWPACIESLRRELPQHPTVRAETFDAQTRDVQDLRPVIRNATESQPEFKLAVWDYIARLVDTQRIADGQTVLAAQAAPLRAIAARRGVDAATAVAVFGVETDYGKVEGRYPVVDATLSRACLDFGSKERKRHFFAALWLLQQGLVQPDAFRGSWAGAFGLTQFMPGTFVAYMDRGEGSGTIDIVRSAPDALATTANFVASSGWIGGLRWGIEVTRPSGAAPTWVATEREHACLGAGASNSAGKCRSVDQWSALGVKPVASAATAPTLAGDAQAALLAPAGPDGPAWLVTRNYQALWQYNRADSYALAIGLLSDALRGDPPMRALWPTDDLGLGRAEMRELQAELLRRGHDDVSVDGFDGPRTREAVRSEERALGWAETGRAGARLLRTLQALK